MLSLSLRWYNPDQVQRVEDSSPLSADYIAAPLAFIWSTIFFDEGALIFVRRFIPQGSARYRVSQL